MVLMMLTSLCPDLLPDIWKPGIKKSELRNAQAKIKDMLEERGGITKMFRIIDEDKSGWCSRKELRMLMVHLNLETVVRPPILEELMNLMDVDGDDQIRYNEFARICAPGAMGDLFDISSAMLQIGIVLASATIITGAIGLAWIAIGLGLIGSTLMIVSVTSPMLIGNIF